MEHPTVKAPFMPRVANAIEDRLAQGWGLDGPSRAGLAILLCFFFGWRESTLARLRTDDVTLLPDVGIYEFSERFSKGVFSSSRFLRRLHFPASASPPMFRAL